MHEGARRWRASEVVTGRLCTVARQIGPRVAREPPASGLRLPLPRPTAIDLFAGAGGLSLGFEQAGFDVLAAVEYDPIAAATHAYNFPATEVLCGDVAAVSGRQILDAAGRGWTSHGRAGRFGDDVDVVVGGPPCQGFSFGGKRAFDDVRNQMVFRFADLVGEIGPRYFVMENVLGLTSLRSTPERDSERLIDLLVRRFASLGYEVEKPWRMNAMEFGVPQDRRRLLLVGTRDGERRPASPKAAFAGRTRSGTLEQAGALSPCPSVSDALSGLPELDCRRDLDRPLLRTDERRLDADDRETLIAAASTYAKVLMGAEDDPTDLSHPRTWDRKLLTSSALTEHRDDVLARFAATSPGTPERISRFLRLHPDGVAPTLRAGTHYERGSFNAPRPIHPSSSRVITVREAARLHAYPDWFRLHWTKWHGFRQVGNSLPSPVGKAVGRQIVKALGRRPRRPAQPLTLGPASLLRFEPVQAAEHFAATSTAVPHNAQRKRNDSAKQETRRATSGAEPAQDRGDAVRSTTVAA